MTAQPGLDFGHTVRAETNRQRKAHALAGASRDLGLRPYELATVGGRPGVQERRARVRRLAQVRDASEETWALAMGQLEGMEKWICGTAECPRCGWPVRTVVSERGRTLLIDPHAHELGTVLPTEGGTRARILAATAPRPDGERLYRQHATSCPGAAATAALAPEETDIPDAPDAPACTACGQPLDAEFARRDPTYTTHPCCDPREGGAT